MSELDLSGLEGEVPDVPDDGIVFRYDKTPDAPVIFEPSTPLEDRFKQDLWIRTRLCFCDKDSKTDCRFHSEKEPGWEECPNLEVAKKGKLPGRWLWAHNPNFGKAPAEEGQEDQAVTA